MLVPSSDTLTHNRPRALTIKGVLFMDEGKSPTPPEVKPQVTPQPTQVTPQPTPHTTPQQEVKPQVVHVIPNKKQKDQIYGQLLNVTDIDKFDKKAFADARGINHQSLGGMIGQMINHTSIYKELMKIGFTDVQIPQWVKRPEAGVGVAVESPLGLAPAPAVALAEKPAIVTLAQENAVSERATERPSEQASRVPALQNTDATIRNATAAAFIQANRELAGTGQRVEALGSNALQQWIREANVQEIGGVYYQRRMLPDGKSALVEVKPPKEIFDAYKMGKAELSHYAHAGVLSLN